MQYDVYVQDKFYITLEADNVGSVLAQISIDIKNGKVEIDNNFSQNIRVEPKT